MTRDGEKNRAVREVGDAINAAIEQSPIVAEALERLRRMGLEADLNVRLEIGLRELQSEESDPPEAIELELTEEDVKVLRRMKIRCED